MYVRDAADLLWNASQLDNPEYRIVNVGVDKANTIRDIVECIKEVIPHASIELGTEDWPAQLPQVDYSRMRRMFQWAPKYTLRDGIRAWISFVASSQVS
jgi:nucleoside-diphosphate-sugar epimerase